MQYVFLAIVLLIFIFGSVLIIRRRINRKQQNFKTQVDMARDETFVQAQYQGYLKNKDMKTRIERDSNNDMDNQD